MLLILHPFTNTRPVTVQESRSICGHIFFYGGCPILWKTHKEKRISRSSCEAEIKATDECVKKMFRCFAIFYQISIFFPLLLQLPSIMIIRVPLIGRILLAQKILFYRECISLSWGVSSLEFPNFQILKFQTLF
jgi:hypothetical protein